MRPILRKTSRPQTIDEDTDAIAIGLLVIRPTYLHLMPHATHALLLNRTITLGSGQYLLGT